MKKKVIELDNSNSLYINGLFVMGFTIEQVEAMETFEGSSRDVLELAKLGYSADDLVKLKQQGVL